MDSGGFQKRTDRLPAHHGWHSKPGYKIFVAIGVALVFVAGLLAPQF